MIGDLGFVFLIPFFFFSLFHFPSLLPCCSQSFRSLPPQFVPVDGGVQQTLGVPASPFVTPGCPARQQGELLLCQSLSVPGWLSQRWPAWTRSTSSAKLLFIFLLVKSVKELSDWQRVINVTRVINYLLWCMGFGRTLCTHFCGVTQPAGRGSVGFVACCLTKKKKQTNNRAGNHRIIEFLGLEGISKVI